MLMKAIMGNVRLEVHLEVEVEKIAELWSQWVCRAHLHILKHSNSLRSFTLGLDILQLC